MIDYTLHTNLSDSLYVVSRKGSSISIFYFAELKINQIYVPS